MHRNFRTLISETADSSTHPFYVLPFSGWQVNTPESEPILPTTEVACCSPDLALPLIALPAFTRSCPHQSFDQKRARQVAQRNRRLRKRHLCCPHLTHCLNRVLRREPSDKEARASPPLPPEETCLLLPPEALPQLIKSENVDMFSDKNCVDLCKGSGDSESYEEEWDPIDSCDGSNSESSKEE